MSIGSSFDAYAKSYLHEKLLGKNHKDASKFELRTLFEAQVEKHNRDWAWKHGEYVFEKYRQSGALSDLMLEMNQSVGEPRFEFDLLGEVKGYREGVTRYNIGVTLFGKPDIRFINSSGAHCIFDWKVNGYCSSYNQSPAKGYVQCREQVNVDTWQRKGAHRDAFIMNLLGMRINSSFYLEQVDVKWARQNASYGWLMGEIVGAEVVSGIDQICCNGMSKYIVDGLGEVPKLRIVSHRTRVSSDFQFMTLALYQDLWDRVTRQPIHFFRELSFEESAIKCRGIESQAQILTDAEADPTAKLGYSWARE